jgi:nucleoside-diphosphate-sugar epimerase
MNSNMKVLITGATGFLGSYLVRLLIQKGYHVRALYRDNSSLKHFADINSEQLEWVNADITDIIALEEAFVGVTHVYHCAALVSFHPKDVQLMQTINVTGTANIVNLCLHFGVKKLIHVSSIAALGRTKLRLEMDETCKWVHSKDNSNYAISKHMAEQEVWRGMAEGLSATIVSPSVVVGSFNWDLGMAAFFKKIDKGLKLYPSGSSGFVDVRDVCEFMEKMLDQRFSGERYILNAVNLKHRAFFELIANSLNVKPPIIMVGPALAELAWLVEWTKEKLFGIAPIVTRESARASVTNYIYRSEKSLSVPGFSYRPFQKTISDTAEQYNEAKKQGYPIKRLPF